MFFSLKQICKSTAITLNPQKKKALNGLSNLPSMNVHLVKTILGCIIPLRPSMQFTCRCHKLLVFKLLEAFRKLWPTKASMHFTYGIYASNWIQLEREMRIKCEKYLINLFISLFLLFFFIEVTLNHGQTQNTPSEVLPLICWINGYSRKLFYDWEKVLTSDKLMEMTETFEKEKKRNSKWKWSFIIHFIKYCLAFLSVIQWKIKKYQRVKTFANGMQHLSLLNILCMKKKQKKWTKKIFEV